MVSLKLTDAGLELLQGSRLPVSVQACWLAILPASGAAVRSRSWPACRSAVDPSRLSCVSLYVDETQELAQSCARCTMS